MAADGGLNSFGCAPKGRGAVSICGSAASARPATTQPRMNDRTSQHFPRSACATASPAQFPTPRPDMNADG